MSSGSNSVATLLGESLSDSVSRQDLNEVADRLKADLEDRDDDSGHNQVALYSDGTVSRSLLYFEKGGYVRDRTIENGTAIIRVLEGKLCFQSGDVHVHPTAGEVFYLEEGTSHSLQADMPSTVLLTIVQSNGG